MHKTSPFQQRARQHWDAGQQADKRRQWDVALRQYEKATQLAPGVSLYWLSLATCALQLNQLEQAASAARQGLHLQPDFMSGRLLAQVLTQQNRHGEAADVYLGLPSSVPRQLPLLSQQAQCLLRAERWQEAMTSYLECLRHDARDPVIYQHLAMAFRHLGRPRDAALCLETAAATDKGGQIAVLALSQLVQMLRHAAEWSELERHTNALLARIDARSPEIAAKIEPFSLLTVPASAAQQQLVGRAHSQALCAGATRLPERGARQPGRWRIGYLSSDFFNHATTHLITEILELQDRARFEIFLYCHSPQDGSPWQQRVRAAADHFVDVGQLSDHAAAMRMRADDLDIVVDLKGYTKSSRMQILAYRPAPVQLSYLGFPGSTGADFLDYVLGDPIVTPLAHAADFSERIAQMPHSYQPNDSQRALPAKPDRATLGLPDDAFVLCSFNQFYKISPTMADLWAQILCQAPHAVLWQVNWNDQAAANFVREMQSRGVEAERLYFSERCTPVEHMARVQCADLMLDTWPCNAHTTASDALWCGVPVLTVPGPTFASRVAASLLTACGLSEMVCADAEAYVATAVALACDPAPLRAAQRHLLTQRDQLPLFDSRRYTRNFDALLQRMCERQAQGLPPEHLEAIAAD